METPATTTAKPKKQRQFLVAASSSAAQQQQLPPTSVTGAPKESTTAAPVREVKAANLEETKEVKVVREAKAANLEETKGEGKTETKGEAKPKSTKTRKFLLAESAAKPKEVVEKPYQERLIEFYTGRKQDYSSYTYTPEGNLLIKQNGVEKETIPLRRFRPLTAEELQQLEEERLNGNKATGQKGIIELENEFDMKMAALRTAHDQWKAGRASAKTVMLANKELMGVQSMLNARIAPERLLDRVGELQIRDIRIDKPKDDRALGYDAVLYIRRAFPRKDLFGRYMTPEEEEALKITGQQGGTAQDVYILDTPEDPELGPLHPYYVKDFSYAATQYSSPLQAFEVERLRELKQDALVQQMMKTRSVRTIQNLGQQEKTPAPNAYELWTGILKAYYSQHPEFADKLKQTGDALFTLHDTNVPASQEFVRALLTVRASLREGDVAPETDVIDRVISEEEQKRAKIGAIIRNKMFHRPG